MLNLNEVSTGTENQTMELIPDKTAVRAIINFTGGDTEKSDFGHGKLFKNSATTSAIWADMEFTIIGGSFDKRRVWSRLFVHGDKMDENGQPVARNIGLQTIRRMIDSIHNLKANDMSPEAQQKRNISGIQDMQGCEFSFLVGIEPENNGYPAKNKMTIVLTPDNSDYVSGNAPAMAPASLAPAAPATAPASGVAPAWAQA